MLKTKYLLLLLLLFGCSKNDSEEITTIINNTKLKNINIRLIDSLIIPIDTIAINDAKLILNINDTIYWYDDHSPELFIFDRKLNLIKHIDYSGRGPGEFNSSYKISFSNNNALIYDPLTKRITRFKGLTKYEGSFNYSKYNINRLVAVNDLKLFLQLRDAKISRKPAFVLIDTSGIELMQGGVKPANAIIQDVISGGSVVVDKNENVYFSYISDYRIWKVNTKTKKISIINNKPSYFKESNPDEVKKLPQHDFAKYYFTHSRTWNIFFVEPNFIIQQIFPEKPTIRPEELYSYLEIFNTEGTKIGTKILFKKEIINVQGEKIYCKSFVSDDLNKTKKIEIYEITL